MNDIVNKKSIPRFNSDVLPVLGQISYGNSLNSRPAQNKYILGNLSINIPMQLTNPENNGKVHGLKCSPHSLDILKSQVINPDIVSQNMSTQLPVSDGIQERSQIISLQSDETGNTNNIPLGGKCSYSTFLGGSHRRIDKDVSLHNFVDTIPGSNTSLGNIRARENSSYVFSTQEPQINDGKGLVQTKTMNSNRNGEYFIHTEEHTTHDSILSSDDWGDESTSISYISPVKSREVSQEIANRNISPKGENSLEQRIIDLVVHHARIMVQDGHVSAIVKLEPPRLGKLKFEIVSDTAKVTCRFFVETAEVKDVIQHTLNDLRTRLGECGLKVDTFDVQVGNNGGMDNWARQEEAQRNFHSNNRSATYFQSHDYEEISVENTYKGSRSLSHNNFDVWM
jgi:hypothetical protein